jgi:tetratricopeptide (TPR) repeat protein
LEPKHMTLEELKILLEEKLQIVQSHIEMGAEAGRQKRFAEVLAYWNKASEMLDTRPLSLAHELEEMRAGLAANLGICHGNLGQLPEALEAYQRAETFCDGDILREKPEAAEIKAQFVENYIICLYSLSQFKECILAIQRAEALFEGKHFRNNSDTDEKRARLEVHRGLCFVGLEQLPKALVAFQRADTLYECENLRDRSDLDIQRAHFNLNFGICLANLTQYQDALAAFQRAEGIYESDTIRTQGGLNLEKGRVELAVNLGNCFANLGKFQEAVAAYKRSELLYERAAMRGVAELDLERARIAVKLGYNLKCIGQWPEALTAFLRAEKFHESDNLLKPPERSQELAYIFLSIGACLEAMEQYELAFTPFWRAHDLFENDNLRVRFELDELRLELATSVGDCFFKTGRPDAAVAHFERALDLLYKGSLKNRLGLDRNRAIVTAALGNCLIALGRFADALSVFKQSQVVINGPRLLRFRELDGDRATLSMNIGICFNKLGELEPAQKAYVLAHAYHDGNALRSRPEFNSDRALLAMNWGVCFQNAGQLEKARAMYESAQAYYEGVELRQQADLDSDRAKLSLNFGNCLQSLGLLKKGLTEMKRAQTLFDSENLKDRSDLDADRAMLLMNTGYTLTSLGLFEKASHAYEKSHSLYSNSNLADRTELDGSRAKLAINQGNHLLARGLSFDAIPYFEKAGELFSNGLFDQDEFEGDRADLTMSLGICALTTGSFKSAAHMFELAHSIYEKPSLKELVELDGGRAKLAANWGLCFLQLEQYTEALDQFRRAEKLHADESLRERAGLDGDRAGLSISLGNCLNGLGQFAASFEAFSIGIRGFEALGAGTPLPLRRNLVVAYSNASDLLTHMSEPQPWARLASAKLCELLDLAPPGLDGLWGDMRSEFLRFHESWLGYCLEVGDHVVIPEVIAAIQGRELLAEIVERLEMDKDIPVADGPNGDLAAFLAQRREMRNILDKLRDPGGSGPVGGDSSRMMMAGTQPAQEDPEQAKLRARYQAMHDRLPDLRDKAAALPGYSALNAPHTRLRQETLQDSLNPGEALLLLFAHGKGDDESGHALVVHPDRQAVYLHCPDLPVMAQQMQRFAATMGGRTGTRLGGYRSELATKPEDTLSPDQMQAFWPDLAMALNHGLWRPLAKPLEGVKVLVGLTSGRLHNLSFEPGRGDTAPLLTRLPGLAFFALKRGLYSADGRDGTDNASLQDQPSGRIAILADESATDIPLAGLEGQHAARFWKQTNDSEYPVEHPSGYPAGDTPLRFLHVAAHGGIVDGDSPQRRAAIFYGERRISEREIITAPRTREALINICVGGQSYDNPQDGDPSGLVSGFLRRGTEWLVASVPPLPDDWACLMGLIITDLKTSTSQGMHDVLPVARHRLVNGGWPERVTEAFSEAVFTGLTTSGTWNKITDTLAAFHDDHDLCKTELARHAASHRHWVLDEALQARLVASGLGADYKTILKDHILQCITGFAANGTPDTPGRDTVRYGITLFGEPGPAPGS